MKTGIIKASTLAVTGRLDAEYNLAILDWLSKENLPETPENVRRAMAAMKEAHK